MHEGHRKRMLKRLRENHSLQDYEILEIVLYRPVRRRNTNETARALLEKFGSLSGVMNATYEELTAVDGVGSETAAYLKCVARVFRKGNGTIFFRLGNYQDFILFVQERFAHVLGTRTEFYAVNKEQEITFIRTLSSNEEPGETAVAELIRACNPYAVIMARGGGGEEGERLAQRAFLMCAVHGVQFYDYIVADGEKAVSYYAAGGLEKLKEDCLRKSIFCGEIDREGD